MFISREELVIAYTESKTFPSHLDSSIIQCYFNSDQWFELNCDFRYYYSNRYTPTQDEYPDGIVTRGRNWHYSWKGQLSWRDRSTAQRIAFLRAPYP